MKFSDLIESLPKECHSQFYVPGETWVDAINQMMRTMDNLITRFQPLKRGDLVTYDYPEIRFSEDGNVIGVEWAVSVNIKDQYNNRVHFIIGEDEVGVNPPGDLKVSFGLPPKGKVFFSYEAEDGWEELPYCIVVPLDKVFGDNLAELTSWHQENNQGGYNPAWRKFIARV